MPDAEIMAVAGMSLLWLQPMSTIVTGGRDGALACESCVSFVTFLALSSSLKFVVLFTLLTIRGFGTSLFSCLHPPANTMSLSLYRIMLYVLNATVAAYRCCVPGGAAIIGITEELRAFERPCSAL